MLLCACRPNGTAAESDCRRSMAPGLADQTFDCHHCFGLRLNVPRQDFEQLSSDRLAAVRPPRCERHDQRVLVSNVQR